MKCEYFYYNNNYNNNFSIKINYGKRETMRMECDYKNELK